MVVIFYEAIEGLRNTLRKGLGVLERKDFKGNLEKTSHC